jgi:anti-anti-sigma factor
MSLQQHVTHDRPDTTPPDRGLTTTTGPIEVFDLPVPAMPDGGRWTASQRRHRWALAPEVVATLTAVTTGVLTAVSAARYASITWAGDRWLTGHAPTHSTVARLDALQAELRQGPCLDVLREHHTVTIPDMRGEARWPAFATRAAELGVASMLSLPLTVRQECLGVLNLYATRPHAFTSTDDITGAAYAAHAAIAVHQAVQRDHLRTMINRDVIGLATGILMERYHLAALPALDRLVRAGRHTGRTLADLAGWLVDGHADQADGRYRSAALPGWQSSLPAAETAVGLQVTSNRAEDAVVVVSASGEVDACTAPDLATAIREACASTPTPGSLVIDLTGIRFFSAAGLTVLLTTQQHCHERHIALRVVATHRSVLRPLQITRLDGQFDLTTSRP